MFPVSSSYPGTLHLWILFHSFKMISNTQEAKVKDCMEFKWSLGMQDFSGDSFQTTGEVYFPLGIGHKKILDLMTTYFSKEDRLIRVVKSIDSHILKRADGALCRNSIWDHPNHGSTTSSSSCQNSRARGCWYQHGPGPLRHTWPALPRLPPTSIPTCPLSCMGVQPCRAAAHHAAQSRGQAAAPAHQLQQHRDFQRN